MVPVVKVVLVVRQDSGGAMWQVWRVVLVVRMEGGACGEDGG